MRTSYDVIIRPLNTERAYADAALRKYTFEVAKDAGKHAIKEAVEEAFDVGRKGSHNDGKGQDKKTRQKSRNNEKLEKAIVKLTPDSKTIEFFEGV